MRIFVMAVAALALVGCDALNSANGPALPQVKAGATPPSTQSPGSPTQQVNVTDEVRQQITTGLTGLLDQQLTSGGGQRIAGLEDKIVPMQPGTDNRFVVDMTAGTNYVAYGQCDGDCTNIDIEIISMETGGVVANDMLPDDWPIANFTPEANGQYMIRTLMQACTQAPCFAATRVITIGGTGAQPAAAPEGKPS